VGVTPRTGDAHKGLRYEVNRGEHSAPRNRGMHPACLSKTFATIVKASDGERSQRMAPQKIQVRMVDQVAREFVCHLLQEHGFRVAEQTAYQVGLSGGGRMAWWRPT